MRPDDPGFGPWDSLVRMSLVSRLRRLADDLEDLEKCVEAVSPDVAINSWTLGGRTVPCLIGRPAGHPAICSGKPACSSELFYLDPDRGIARTMSRWYRLGTPVDPEYWEERFREKVYPPRDSH